MCRARAGRSSGGMAECMVTDEESPARERESAAGGAGAVETPDPDARDGAGWVAPLLATLAGLAGCPFTLLVWGLSPMACDSCAGAELAAFESRYQVASVVTWISLGLAAILLTVSWSLPWVRRYSAARVGYALGAGCAGVVGLTAALTVAG